jgi:cell wall-associated NlpC family hydrolase
VSVSVPTVGGAAVATRIAQIRQRFEPLPGTGATPAAASFDSLMATLGQDGAGALDGLGLGGRASGDGSLGAAAVAKAMEYQGIPYLWGGTDPDVGLDCSGFVQHVFGQLGIDLPRVSRDQAKAGVEVPSLAEAKPGDLIAFGSPVDHIAIYLGDGKIIHAPRTGEVIKVTDIHRTPTAIRRLGATEATGAALPGAALSGTGLAGLGALGAAGSSAILQDPAVARYSNLFAQAGRRHGIDPSILAAVAKVESGGNPGAVSSAGARGLMQFMPATARGYGIDPMDPAQAIDGAARMLTEQRNAFGTLELALAAYNAGPGAVRRHGGIPPYSETRNYVRKVMSLVNAS